MRSLEPEFIVNATLSLDREGDANRRSLDDMIYMVMGEATPGNILMMIFAVTFFGAAPLAMLFLFGTYSGGMGWLIVLGLVTAMGAVAVFLMSRGLARHPEAIPERIPMTRYPGKLTSLTETFERAGAGYIYSQQVIREKLCDIAIDKIALARDMDGEEIMSLLEKGDAGFTDDRFLSLFLLANRRGAKSQDEMLMQGKGKSKERGEKFILEIDEVMLHVEAIT